MGKSNSHFLNVLILAAMASMINGCQTDKLERISYTSQVSGEERDFFLYLPNGYEMTDRKWPVLMFLHGNGERGNGKDELGYVLKHGPLMEAWIQKKDLPFIIISPQLHMFGMDTVGIDYLTNRDPNTIPQRLEVLGHTEVLFTNHEDMGHDAWKRIYAGQDLYDWLLAHQLNFDTEK